MADFTGQAGPSNGLESTSLGGASNLPIPGSIDLPAQSMQVDFTTLHAALTLEYLFEPPMMPCLHLTLYADTVLVTF